MNIFEGARRIAKIFYALIGVVGLSLATGTNPYLSRYYVFDDKFDLVSTEDCGQSSWFIANVEGRPNWASISVCGGLKGPTTVQLNNLELTKLDDAIYERRMDHFGRFFAGTLAFLVGAMVMVWCIGWIVRGFMGIPRGQDKK
jgi:hypothetical protein